jgi:hypothetical protein
VSGTARCRVCAHARYTPARDKVGCTLLTGMTGIEVLSAVSGELHRLWRGKVHPAMFPDAAPTPLDGFADRSVIVPASDRCSRFAARAA